MAGPGVGRGGLPGQDEDAGADDGADAEHDELARAEHARQAAAVSLRAAPIESVRWAWSRKWTSGLSAASLCGAGREVMKARSNARKKPSSSSQGRDNIRVFPCPPLRPRRSPPTVNAFPASSFGPFTFDAHTRLLSRDGQEVALPPRVLGVLELLLHRAGDVVSRQELIDSGVEGRVRHRHVARRSRQRPASGAWRRPAVADLHPDAPPARLSIRGAGVDGRRAGRPARRGTSRGAGHRTTRLPFHRRASSCRGAPRSSVRCWRSPRSGN